MPKQVVWMSDVEVVEVTAATITVNLGRNVTITMHTVNFPHTCQVGDKIPLYTELPYAQLSQSSLQ